MTVAWPCAPGAHPSAVGVKRRSRTKGVCVHFRSPYQLFSVAQARRRILYIIGRSIFRLVSSSSCQSSKLLNAGCRNSRQNCFLFRVSHQKCALPTGSTCCTHLPLAPSKQTLKVRLCRGKRCGRSIGPNYPSAPNGPEWLAHLWAACRQTMPGVSGYSLVT